MSTPSTGGSLLTLLDRPIAFHRSFVRLAGSVNAALMLSQSLYWANRTSDPEGWWWKTQEDWTEETGLTRREQEYARSALRSAGVLEEKNAGLPKKLFFRVRIDVLESLLTSLNPPECTKRALKSARNGHSSLHETCTQERTKEPVINKETETTPETTPETTEREQSASPSQSNNSPGSLSDDTQFPSQSSPNNSSDRGPFSDSHYQRNRFFEWVKDHWESLQSEYLPYFQNNADLLRWSLNKCIAWAFDNADKARKFSNPGMRIRKWLDEEDVDRLIRAMEGQGRAAQRVATTEISRSNAEAGYVPDIDSTDIVGLVAHYHKIFGLFQEFARDFFSRSFVKSDWDNLEEDIRSNPEKYAEPGHAGFAVMYEFFGINPVGANK